MPVLIGTGMQHIGVSEREDTGSFAIIAPPGDRPVKVVVELDVTPVVSDG